MAELSASSYIFGIIAFTLLIVGGVSILGYFNSDSTLVNSEAYTEFNATFNKLDAVTTNIEAMENKTSTTSVDFGLYGTFNALMNAVWNSVKLLFTSLSFMGSVFTGLTEFFGVPAWITTLIGLAATTLILFVVWAAVFRGRI